MAQVRRNRGNLFQPADHKTYFLKVKDCRSNTFTKKGFIPEQTTINSFGTSERKSSKGRMRRSTLPAALRAQKQSPQVLAHATAWMTHSYTCLTWV